MRTPAHQHRPDSFDTGGTLHRAFAKHLHRTLEAVMPAGATDRRADLDENRQSTQELFGSLNPRDPAEAQLAAIAIGAARSAMDNFARAARPGVTDETAIRLHGSAFAAGRTCAAALRALHVRPPKPAVGRRPAGAPKPAPAADPPRPDAAPARDCDEFQPRDRFGKPIPIFRTEQMTRAQLLAILAWPRNAALEATAIVEEQAMITEQAALQAKEQVPPGGADSE